MMSNKVICIKCCDQYYLDEIRFSTKITGEKYIYICKGCSTCSHKLDEFYYKEDKMKMNNKKIIAYMILSNIRVSTLCKLVVVALKNGYQPFGGVSVCMGKDSVREYYQAMVEYETD